MVGQDCHIRCLRASNRPTHEFVPDLVDTAAVVDQSHQCVVTVKDTPLSQVEHVSDQFLRIYFSHIKRKVYEYVSYRFSAGSRTFPNDDF